MLRYILTMIDLSGFSLYGSQLMTYLEGGQSGSLKYYTKHRMRSTHGNRKDKMKFKFTTPSGSPTRRYKIAISIDGKKYVQRGILDTRRCEKERFRKSAMNYKTNSTTFLTLESSLKHWKQKFVPHQMINDYRNRLAFLTHFLGVS